MSEDQDGYDVVVLGAGSGGYACALRASQLGLRVALIEKAELGGTCLHRGCIPTKALLHAAEVADEVRDAARLGLHATLEGIDGAQLLQYQQSVVANLYRGLSGLIRSRGITQIAGHGYLVSQDAVAVRTEAGHSQVVRGKSLVLATGARPRLLPGVELGHRILTSDQALRQEQVPQRAVVLGGGVIGTEFASLWRSLGAEVTIVEALDSLLPGEDAGIRTQLERALAKRGISIRTGVRVTAATETADAATVQLDDHTALEADVVLVAVGRAPVTADIGLQDAGVATDSGFVVVDDQLRSSVPGIYALGDTVRGPQLAHRGFAQGIATAERIAGLSPMAIIDETIPRVTYCSPQVASVGLTEEAARERFGDDIDSVEYSLAGNGKSQILGTSGLVKMVRRKDGPIVGVHLLGDRMGEQISEAQLLVNWEAYPQDVAPLIHAHPTQNEALGEAALALAGTPLHSHN